MPNALTYGQVKSALASAYDGGMSLADNRLLPNANQAIDLLIRNAVKVNPRGLFVGGVDVLSIGVQASISTFTGKLIVLPVTHDTIIQVEILSSGDVTNGWYNVLDLSGLVNPDMQQDVIFYERGELSIGGQRIYEVPDAAVGATVKVTAIKRFNPIASDSDILPIRSLDALRFAFKAIQYYHDINDPQKGDFYQAKALDELKSEFDRYLADSTQSLARKQAFKNDEKTYAVNTLGYIRARLALDVIGGQLVGKTVITRTINRAVERLLQHRNEIRTTGRLSVKTGIDNVAFVAKYQASDVLQISDYEQIRCMIRSFDEKDAGAGTWEAKAYKLLEDQELNALETLRHTTYSASLAGAAQFSLNYYAYKWGLDAPDGLRYSDVELKRLAQTAAEFIYQEKYNYQLVERNRIKTGVPTLSTVPGGDTVTFGDPIPYREMKLAMDSFAYQGDPVSKTINPQAASLQESVKAMLKPRLEAELESLRHTTYANTLQTIIAANGIQTLGYAFNKLQLELPDGIRISDVEMRRLVNEAVREAIQRRNELGAQEEYTNLIGPDQLPFTYTTSDGGTLPYSDYEIIRLLVLSMLPGSSSALKDEAFTRIEANLRKEAIAYRNSEAHCTIQSNPYPQFGGAWAQLVLEYQDGLQMNSNKAKRIVAEAWKQAVSHYNFLARQENYQATELALPVPIVDSSVIPFPIEIIKDLSEGQLLSDTKNKGLADQYKQQALAAVERDLVQKLESSRRNLWEANLSLPEWSFGWIKAKVGLGLAELGFSMPDSKLGRMLNDAERELAKTTNFVNDEADIVAPVVDGHVVLPSDCTRIIYADICGFPIRTMSRSYDYLGYPASYANRNSALNWWGYVGPWGYRGRAQLVDAGFDSSGNRKYCFTGCYYNGTVTMDTPAATLNVVCKRKHVPRVNNTDIMLVRDVLALRAAVESELARLNKDLNSAGALWNLALQSLDQALSDKAGSDTYCPKIVFAGQRSVSRRGLARNGYSGRW